MFGVNYLQYVLPLMVLQLISAQFPNHVDLQKVSEIQFNNEKYNILKPTVHKITDHFKDFMRREIRNKGERVFIDDNGFRHFWSGLGLKQSRRRATNNKEETDKKETIDNLSKVGKKELKPQNTSSEEKKIKDMLRQADTTSTTTAKPAEAKKKVAITTFFCPFFGIMKMTSFIE